MVAIHPVTDPADYPQLEAIQREVWQVEDLEILPARTMHALVHNGAQLHGAYADGRLVGFVFGVPGTMTKTRLGNDTQAAAQLKMYSVMMGVLPAYQSQGIGYQLKLAQRNFADNLGVQLVTWTYDPLETRNGWLNIGKLGCVCGLYLRDFHGELGGINAGLNTDRFEVSWWISSSRVQTRIGEEQRRPPSLDSILAEGAVLVNEVLMTAEGLPAPPDTSKPLEANLLTIEMPAGFQAIKQRDMGLARAWRQHARELFEAAFARGYTVTDLARSHLSDGQLRAFYVLSRGDAWR